MAGKYIREQPHRFVTIIMGNIMAYKGYKIGYTLGYDQTEDKLLSTTIGISAGAVSGGLTGIVMSLIFRTPNTVLIIPGVAFSLCFIGRRRRF